MGERKSNTFYASKLRSRSQIGPGMADMKWSCPGLRGVPGIAVEEKSQVGCRESGVLSEDKLKGQAGSQNRRWGKRAKAEAIRAPS